MTQRFWLVLACGAFGFGCGGSAGTTPSYGNDCPVSTQQGNLALEIDLDASAQADVEVLRDGAPLGEALHVSGQRSLSAGPYQLAVHRVRTTGQLIGAAFQGAIANGSENVCVHAGATTQVKVVYTREPGSTKLWVTQTNGDGPQVAAFDAAALTTPGSLAPSVGLSPALENAGPMRIDGLGRLWVASNTGKLVAYAASRLGSNAAAPDIVIQGASVCEDIVPCGPTALAFDAQGALWVATLRRIVKLAAASLEQSGEPLPAVTLESPDAPSPRGLAFDGAGNLWVADASGAIVKFSAARLAHDIEAGAADTVIFAQQPGPVMAQLDEPEGLVFDRDGNLWVGYFGGNDVVRFTPSELGRSAAQSDPLVPSLHFKVGAEALVTDLALDEAGNLWLPGRPGTLSRIEAAQLAQAEPALQSFSVNGLGSAEKLVFDSVVGPLFIAP